MHKFTTSYKVISIILLCTLLMLCGCSKAKEAFADDPSKAPFSPAPQPTAETPSAETLPEEPAADTTAAAITSVNWESYFDGINGAAVIYSPSENSYQIYNQKTALIQRSPCSTFKIISSLIALENGVISPYDSIRTWSGEVFWNEKWNNNMNFEDAFRTSCVWYYRKIINEIGKDTMQQELNRLSYGNCNISDWEGRLNTNNSNRSLTGFWIESSLKISPKEQTEVMERIFGEHSIYSQEVQNTLKQVMLVSDLQSENTFIYGKTGMGKSHGIVVDAWFVGFADTINGRSYFCIYLSETDGKNVSSSKAKEIAIEIVSDLEKV